MADNFSIKDMLLAGDPVLIKMLQAALARDDFGSLPSDKRLDYLKSAVTSTELHELKMKIASNLGLTATYTHLNKIVK